MTPTKKFNVVYGPSPDDLEASYLREFPINFFAVQDPKQAAWPIPVTIISRRPHGPNWIFEGQYEDPETGSLIPVSGVVSRNPPHAGELFLQYV